MSVAGDLVTYLEAQAVGVAGTDLFVGPLPDAPLDVTALIETGGDQSIRAMAAGAGQALAERPTVQVLTRGSTPQIARARVDAVRAVLDGLNRATLSGKFYHSILGAQPPTWLGYDENRRSLYTWNLEVVKAL